MKYYVRILVSLAIAAGAVAGCGNGTQAPAGVVTPPPAQVTGISTPKAVSVVTAN
jgi:hypothetical protein